MFLLFTTSTFSGEDEVLEIQGLGGVRTTPEWFGESARRLCGWLTWPAAGMGRSGVVIVPPLGYDQLTAHRGLRVLAETLASEGHLVLRYDHFATGDSAGDPWVDQDVVGAWRDGVASAAGVLRGYGCERVTVVGLRFGALLGLLEGAAVDAAAVVAWAPVASGKRYVRELRLLGSEVPPEHDRGGAIVQAGDVYTAQALSDLAALPAAPESRPAPRVLIVEDGEAAKLTAALLKLGATVDHAPADGTEQVVGTTAEVPGAPAPLVARIAEWIGAAPATDATPANAAADAVIPWGDGVVREQVLCLGPRKLVAVASDPVPEPDPAAATVLFLNSGSEPHTGPGRAWVTFARELALRGHRAVRLDFRGWGESPDDDKAPGRPYDEHGVDDVRDAVEALRAAGHRRVIPFGLCSGAFIALKAAVADGSQTSGAIALNPQIYWTRDMPNTLTYSASLAWGEPLRARWRAGQRRGEWTLLDLLGHRNAPATWLMQLAEAPERTTFIFAEGDLGMEYLRVRLGRRLTAALRRGGLKIREVPDIDHSMYQAWRREAVLDAILDHLGQGGELTSTRVATTSAAA